MVPMDNNLGISAPSADPIAKARVEKYSPSQARDDRGRWTSDGMGGSIMSADGVTTHVRADGSAKLSYSDGYRVATLDSLRGKVSDGFLAEHEQRIVNGMEFTPEQWEKRMRTARMALGLEAGGRDWSKENG